MMSRDDTASPERHGVPLNLGCDVLASQNKSYEKLARQEFSDWVRHCEEYPERWRLLWTTLEAPHIQLIRELRWLQSAPISEPHASCDDLPATDVTSHFLRSPTPTGSLSRTAELGTSCSSPHLPSLSTSPSSVTTLPDQTYLVPRPSDVDGALTANVARCHTTSKSDVQQVLLNTKTGARQPKRRSKRKTGNTPGATTGSGKVSKSGESYKNGSRVNKKSRKRIEPR